MGLSVAIGLYPQSPQSLSICNTGYMSGVNKVVIGGDRDLLYMYRIRRQGEGGQRNKKATSIRGGSSPHKAGFDFGDPVCCMWEISAPTRKCKDRPQQGTGISWARQRATTGTTGTTITTTRTRELSLTAGQPIYRSKCDRCTASHHPDPSSLAD